MAISALDVSPNIEIATVASLLRNDMNLKSWTQRPRRSAKNAENWWLVRGWIQ